MSSGQALAQSAESLAPSAHCTHHPPTARPHRCINTLIMHTTCMSMGATQAAPLDIDHTAGLPARQSPSLSAMSYSVCRARYTPRLNLLVQLPSRPWGPEVCGPPSPAPPEVTTLNGRSVTPLSPTIDCFMSCSPQLPRPRPAAMSNPPQRRPQALTGLSTIIRTSRHHIDLHPPLDPSAMHNAASQRPSCRADQQFRPMQSESQRDGMRRVVQILLALPFLLDFKRGSR